MTTIKTIKPSTAHPQWVGKPVSDFLNAVEYAIEDHGDAFDWSKFFGSDCGVATTERAREQAKRVANLATLTISCNR